MSHVSSSLAAPLVAFLCACTTAPPANPIRVIEHGLEFDAVVTAAGFAAGEMAGYHLIVWNGGGAADHALLRSEISDEQVIDALEALGSRPGDALGIDAWDDRDDAGSAAPDRVIEGDAVIVELVVPGQQQPLGLGDVLEDPGERGFDMRFGGHRANIPRWHSGCVVCLYSCPGSKVGNASYTVRDFVAGSTHFAVRPGVLPADGTVVTVRIRAARRIPAPLPSPSP